MSIRAPAIPLSGVESSLSTSSSTRFTAWRPARERSMWVAALACSVWMATEGLRVTAIDLFPDAIDMASGSRARPAAI
jgi:hypothetical protein